MLICKSLVSFIAAIALASTVTAATTPVPQNDHPAGATTPMPEKGNPAGATTPVPAGNGHPTKPAQQCGTGKLMCCDSTKPFGEVPTANQGPLAKLAPNLNTNLLVGSGCTPTDAVACGNQLPACCDGVVNQSGLEKVGFNCADISG